MNKLTTEEDFLSLVERTNLIKRNFLESLDQEIDNLLVHVAQSVKLPDNLDDGVDVQLRKYLNKPKLEHDVKI